MASPPSSGVASSPPTTNSRRSSTSSNYDEEVLDPRVQVELEKLNHATDAINRLELELDEARGAFRQMLTESAVKLNALSKKLGSCIEKARPYYEARMHCKEAQMETQKAAIRFERANSMHVAAKEMVALAEQGLARQGRGGFDPAWQEMLNHSTMKVNEAEQERIASESYHKLASHRYQEADQYVKFLQKDLKRNIAKSRSYFETKAKLNQLMEEQKTRVTKLEEQVLQTKKLYAESLQNLEQISDEIHQQREEQRIMRSLGSRESGVGAETPDPPHKVETPSPERAKPPKVATNAAAVIANSPSSSPSSQEGSAQLGSTSTTTITATTTASSSAVPPPPPEISLNPPESDEDEEEPELTAVVDFNDIKDSLREIKESLSACTTPERGASPIPQEETADDGCRSGDDDVFKQPRFPTIPQQQMATVRDAASAAVAVVSGSPKGLASLGSEGNLSSFNAPPRAGSGLSSASRSSSFHRHLGIARPLTASSNASSVDDLESETESLASVEMLGDQQIEMLMMDEEIAAMKRHSEEGAGVVGSAGDGSESDAMGNTKRESELEQVLRSISLKHSVSLEKLKNIALNIKEASKRPVNLNDACEDSNLQE